MHSAEGDGSSNLSSHHRLHTLACAEIERPRDINQQHNGEFALLLKHFHVRLAETCCDIPVYVANVIAKLILANLGKRHTPTLKGRMVLACEYVLAQTLRLDFYLANLFKYL